MSDCQHFELAIDRRLHAASALAPDEAAALEAHLATCDACRAYEASARDLERGLQTRADESRETVDWDRIERGVRANLRARFRKLVAGVLIGALVVAISTWGFAVPGEELDVILGVGTLVAAVVLGRAVFVVREVRAVAGLARGGELIARHRAMLAKQVRTIRRFRWIALVVTLACVALAVRGGEPRHVIVHAILACIVAGTWLHTLLVGYPRLRRELAEIGEIGEIGAEGPR